MTPTQRTLELLRELGYEPDVTERWIPKVKIRKDLYGCIDVLAAHPTHGILGVQATSDNGGNMSARIHKALQEPRLAVWLAAGGQFEVWAWGKRGARGKPKLWRVRRSRAWLHAGVVSFTALGGE